MNLNFLQFLQDESGEYSSSRGILIAWTIGVLFCWGWVSLSSSTLQPIPETVLTLIGILVTGKTIQKKIEKQENKKE